MNATVYLVIENEPDHDEFPSVVVAIYDNRQAAEEHIMAVREEHGLADEEEYEESDITWEVEERVVFSTPMVLVVDTQARGEN